MTQKDEQLVVANQKVKSIAAKAVQAFQLTTKYNTVPNFEAIDKEIEVDEAAQATAAIDENPTNPREGGNYALAT